MMKVWKMKTTTLVFCFALAEVVNTSDGFYNVTVEPALRQLYDFRLEHPEPIGLLTTSAGLPVEIRDTVLLNSDQFSKQYQFDLQTSFDGERIPERVVHAKGTGAFGYFIVTNDVSNYTSADLFNGIGKKVPLVARFSSALSSLGGTDLLSEQKGLAFKFYTNEGNLDLLCLQIPIFFHKQPTDFPYLIHSQRKNPRTSVYDSTARWDAVTKLPEFLHANLWVMSDYGRPNGYRRMNAFAIHTFEISNKKGERHYVKFNFRTEQGLANLTIEQTAKIQGTDLDHNTRDLYNAIGRKQFPSWRLEMDIMSVEDVKKSKYDPFDVTVLWREGTYKTVQIGRVVLNRNPDNMFASIELSSFSPGNLVPGIPGPVDNLFKARRLFYRDTQNYRAGTNINKIIVNLPNYALTYVRDGKPPVGENMKDAPNYYPNSFNGPMPYVDETKPKETLLVFGSNAADFGQSAYFYNHVLETESQRQRLVEVIVRSLVCVTPFVQRRAVKFMKLVDKDFGKHITTGLKKALAATKYGSSC